MSKFSDLMSKTLAALPTRLIQNEDEICLIPGSAEEPAITAFKWKFGEEANDFEMMAIQLQGLTLTEVRGIKQLKKDSKDDWMFILELTIAAPSARIGEVDDNGVFAELPLYEQAKVFSSQIPMIYGQHMRVDPTEFDRLRVLLREHDWVALEIGQGTNSPSSDKREVAFHLAAPSRHKSFSDQIAERVTTGLPVNKVWLNPSTDPEYPGFKDFASAMSDNFKLVIQDEASADPDVKKKSVTLVSSLTGLTNWTTADNVVKRSPIRASLPKLEINGDLFSFWSDTTQAKPKA